MNRPDVSIVMPTFERLEFLRPTIRSVLAQSLLNWELIIVDDGSGEDVIHYLESVAKDVRVTLLQSNHTGNPSAVRNFGIAHAKASIVAFLDSDDLWLPRKLEKQIAMMRNREHCGWSYTAFVTVDAFGDPLDSEKERRWIPHEGFIFDATVRTEATIRTSAVAVRTNLLRHVQGFDEAIDCGEDYDLWVRLAQESEASVLNEPVVLYRRYSGNTSRAPGHAHSARDHTLRKLAAQTAGSAHALVTEERSRNALAMAAELAEHGQRLRSLQSLLRSASFSWRYARWWSGAVKAVLRACLPRAPHRESADLTCPH